MKNLKRILSLALASVMVMGMMVVGASAAFNDQADISVANADAVNTMVALKIISGEPDGSFNPTGDVTRAQMATMIAVALHGGDATFRGSTSTDFTDVNDVNHWAARYIKYCSDQEIISGVGGGKFNPDGNVTAQEAATMILLAMGYKKAQLAAPAGTDWASKINKKAEDRGIYNDTSVSDYSAKIDRQTAAQMIFNGITATTPQWSEEWGSQGDNFTMDGEAGDSILTKAYNAKIQYAVLEKSEYNTKTGKFTYTLTDNNVGADTGKVSGTVYLNTTIDVTDCFMQTVKIIYTGTSITAKTNAAEVWGIVPAGEGVMGEGVVGSGFTVKDGEVKGVPAESSIAVHAFNNKTNSNAAANAWDTYKLIDTNLNGKADCAVVAGTTVAQVSGAPGKTTINIGGTSYKFEENTIPSDLKDKDWVTVTPSVEVKNVVEKLAATENVKATAKDPKNANKWTIGGETYTDVRATKNPAIALGTDYTLVALNGCIFGAEEYKEGAAAAGLKDVLMVTEIGAVVAGKNDLDGNTTSLTQKVRVLFTNDTTPTVITVSKMTDANGDPDNMVKGSNCDSGTHTGCTHAAIDTLYTYKVLKDGTYQLAELKVTSGKWNDYAEDKTATWVDQGVTDNKIRFNNDAAVFVKVSGVTQADGVTTKDEYKLLTGAEVNAWNTGDGNNAAGYNVENTSRLYTEEKSGFKYTVLGMLIMDSTNIHTWPGDKSTSNTKYGYLTAASQEVYDATLDDEAIRMTIWNGEEEVKLLTTQSLTVGDYPAGTPIIYTVNADGTITVDTTKTAAIAAKAVGAYDGIDTLAFAGALSTEYDVTDTVLVFFDSEEGEGVETGSIQLAKDGDVANSKVNNVYAYIDGNKLVALFVDIKNDIDAAPAAIKFTTNLEATKVAANGTLANPGVTLTVAVEAVTADSTVALTYAWYKDNSATPIAGATSATYTATAAGSYHCVVTRTLGSKTVSAQSATCAVSEAAAD